MRINTARQQIFPLHKYRTLRFIHFLLRLVIQLFLLASAPLPRRRPSTTTSVAVPGILRPRPAARTSTLTATGVFPGTSLATTETVLFGRLSVLGTLLLPFWSRRTGRRRRPPPLLGASLVVRRSTSPIRRLLPTRSSLPFSSCRIPMPTHYFSTFIYPRFHTTVLSYYSTSLP